MNELPTITASTKELNEYGSSLRKTLSRKDQGILVLPERDTIAIMEEQHSSRLQGLVPVRVGRMLESPFTFYRGSAAIMAHDLADAPTTNVEVVSCGDAHISNFGWFASPERALTFDLNDFDEASSAPWEWDVKRMVTSAYLAAMDNGLRPDQAHDIAQEAAKTYRRALAGLMEMTALDRYYFRASSEIIEDRVEGSARKTFNRTTRKAKQNNSDRVLKKIEIVETEDGQRIVDEYPILRHNENASVELAESLLFDYLKTVRSDIAVLLSRFTLEDVVLRVVGVGSVGTRCFIALLKGPQGEPFFLQFKEAPPTVLETYGKRTPQILGRPVEQGPGFNGMRVIACQRTLQAVSDPFLGHFHYGGRDFYVRQFRDMKGSFDVSTMDRAQLERYCKLCGALLARGHSQSPKAAIIDGYLNDSKRFDEAIADWAKAYYDVVQRDYEDLVKAVNSGRVPVERDA